jgi:hypothetical protein
MAVHENTIAIGQGSFSNLSSVFKVHLAVAVSLKTLILMYSN